MNSIMRLAGALGEIRTPDPRIRSPMLYPAELRARASFRWVSRTPNFLGIVRGRPPKSISTPDYQSWPERATGWGKPDNMRIGVPQRPAGVNCVMLFRIAR